MDKIKTLVRYDANEMTIWDADDESLGFFTPDGSDVDAIGNQIANALNTAADQSRVIEELETAIEQFLAWFGSSSQWERENRNAKPVTRKDVRGLRDALRFKDAEAQRIMEGK